MILILEINGYSNRCYNIRIDSRYEPWFTVHDIELIQEILDKKEKEYLSNIVKPFKDKVKYISKLGAGDEYISILLDTEMINFPYFKRNTMYKGMKNRKEYTLEELGI